MSVAGERGTERTGGRQSQRALRSLRHHIDQTLLGRVQVVCAREMLAKGELRRRLGEDEFIQDFCGEDDACAKEAGGSGTREENPNGSREQSPACKETGRVGKISGEGDLSTGASSGLLCLLLGRRAHIDL